MKIMDYLVGLFLIGAFCFATFKFSERFGIESPKNAATIGEINVCAGDSFTIKDFVLELHIQKIQYPDVVLRQACLESGWFTSLAWRKNNNPFGFRVKDGYILFNDWKSSISYMHDWQDKYYKGGDYYLFLDRICYAADTNYVVTLKNMDLNNLKNIQK